MAHERLLMGLKSHPLIDGSIAKQCIQKLFTIHYSLFTLSGGTA